MYQAPNNPIRVFSKRLASSGLMGTFYIPMDVLIVEYTAAMVRELLTSVPQRNVVTVALGIESPREAKSRGRPVIAPFRFPV